MKSCCSQIFIAFFLLSIHFLDASGKNNTLPVMSDDSLTSKVNAYFVQAKNHMFKDELDSAIVIYKKIMVIDSTYAEAWEGIGKMLYWKGYPKSALEYYSKAVSLDPTNKMLAQDYKKIKNELKFIVSASLHKINENEDTYNIDAIVQKYSLNKRTGDHFSFSINPMLDYSKREYSDNTTEKRWYDNTWVKFTFLSPHHKLSAFIGASASDDKLTSYGLSWNAIFNISKIKIKNTITAAYDYFYYWNEVGHDYISNYLSINYKCIILDGTYRYAVVRNNFIWDFEEKEKNPNTLFNTAIKFRIFNKPKIYLGVSNQYRNYEYQSPLYYTPYERSLYGIYFSEYYSKNKFYNYIDFFYGKDNYNIINWTGNIEIGLTTDKISYSLGGSRFYNEFYQNYNLFFAVKAIL
jgi:hypothetical protein